MNIANDGWRFILPCATVALLFAGLGWWALAAAFLGFSAAFAFFFRDPARGAPGGEGDLLSPADGRVLKVETVANHSALEGPVTRITIFLSLFDVHITRAPVSGCVDKLEYRPGRFFPAYWDEAGEKNESTSLQIRGGVVDVHLKQIVGLAARRIRCFVKQGDSVVRGQKIGLMYFGSRVEICLPASARPTVAAGRKVRGGETIIAEVKK